MGVAQMRKRKQHIADDQSAALVDFVSQALAQMGDPRVALKMAAYMKTTQPFYGVPRPKTALLTKQVLARFRAPNQRVYERRVQALWRLSNREERYMAIDYARGDPRFIVPASMKLYERLIREGQWWDFVDDIAEYLVGTVLLGYRSETRPTLDRWIDDSDLWIRRAALIAQVKHKTATDQEQLFDYCLRRSAESDFFIRKAIGWALRAYSKSNPEAVRAFLLNNRAALAPLSLREGARHLIRLGRLPVSFPAKA